MSLIHHLNYLYSYAIIFPWSINVAFHSWSNPISFLHCLSCKSVFRAFLSSLLIILPQQSLHLPQNLLWIGNKQMEEKSSSIGIGADQAGLVLAGLFFNCVHVFVIPICKSSKMKCSIAMCCCWAWNIYSGPLISFSGCILRMINLTRPLLETFLCSCWAFASIRSLIFT